MKSAGEVLGELLIACLRALTPEEREELFVKGKMAGKKIQFTLPDEHEAIVITFAEVEGRPSLLYETYPSPTFICRACGWQGSWLDLHVTEEEMDLTGKISELELFKPIIKTTIENCIRCDARKKLKYYDYEHEDVDLILKGTFGDIGKVAEIQIGGFGHKFKQLFVVLWLLLRGRVSIKPLRRLGTAITVSKLLTGIVSEDYKED